MSNNNSHTNRIGHERMVSALPFSIVLDTWDVRILDFLYMRTAQSNDHQALDISDTLLSCMRDGKSPRLSMKRTDSLDSLSKSILLRSNSATSLSGRAKKKLALEPAVDQSLFQFLSDSSAESKRYHFQKMESLSDKVLCMDVSPSSEKPGLQTIKSAPEKSDQKFKGKKRLRWGSSTICTSEQELEPLIKDSKHTPSSQKG